MVGVSVVGLPVPPPASIQRHISGVNPLRACKKSISSCVIPSKGLGCVGSVGMVVVSGPSGSSALYVGLSPVKLITLFKRPPASESVTKSTGFSEVIISVKSKLPPPYVPCMIAVVTPGARGPTRGVRT